MGKQWSTHLGLVLTSEYSPRKWALEFLKNEQELIMWRRKEIRKENKDRISLDKKARDVIKHLCSFLRWSTGVRAWRDLYVKIRKWIIS